MNQDLSGQLWLTSTERLARSLQRTIRNRYLKQGLNGWEHPDIISLNAWIDREWTDSWPATLPAPDLVRMVLWKRIIEEVPPPGILEGNILLYRSLDEIFRILARHKINPRSSLPAAPLVEWRRIISDLFSSRLAEQGLFHPGETAIHLRRAIVEGIIKLPESCSILGFEFPAPIEKDLFALFEKMSRTDYNSLVNPSKGAINAVALPTPEQEITFLCSSLAEDALTFPLHRLGVIVPNLDSYASRLARSLEDVLGKTAASGHTWFNITLGIPLSELPLFKAALLPFRFFLEGEKRTALLSLVLSPYFRQWQTVRSLAARADRIWRNRGIGSDMDELRRSLAGAEGNPEYLIFHESAHLFSSLRASLAKGKASLSFWINKLNETWNALGFPVMADETDHLAWRHLKAIRNDFLAQISDVYLDGAEFIDWITHRASLETTQPERAEDAGIQIMGIIEARGLDFDKIYLIDANDRSLPQPVRPLPMLDSFERSLIQGGTAQGQFEFAETAVNRILHSASSVVFLRAEQDGTKPLAPSPFWPADSERRSVNIWTDPDPGWLRTSWLQSAWNCLKEESSTTGVDRFPLSNSSMMSRLSRGLSPSRLKTALACPFLFLAQEILRIEPLEDTTMHPSPMERGSRIHDILATFTRKLREEKINPADDREQTMNLLSRSVDKALADLADHPAWNLEKARLLGSPDSDFPGVLEAWLDHEAAYRTTGWLCRAEETEFLSLHVDGCPYPLRGRIDRIDYHEAEGWVCFDYKTGKLPSRTDVCEHFREPQLAVYLMALRDLLIPRITGSRSKTLIHGAGYIRVSYSGGIQYRLIDGLMESLGTWKNIIVDIGNRIAEGRFDSTPWPLSPGEKKETACVDCSFRTLCSRGLSRDLPQQEEDDDEGIDCGYEGFRDD